MLADGAPAVRPGTMRIVTLLALVEAPAVLARGKCAGDALSQLPR